MSYEKPDGTPFHEELWDNNNHNFHSEEAAREEHVYHEKADGRLFHEEL